MVEFTYMRPVPYQIEAREVLREVGKLPHMLLRIEARGGRFPQRALEPFARIENGAKTTRALLCEVAEDETSLCAYFPTDVAQKGSLVVGYGSEIVAVFPLGRIGLRPQRLDLALIQGRFHRVTQRDLGAFGRRRG